MSDTGFAPKEDPGPPEPNNDYVGLLFVGDTEPEPKIPLSKLCQGGYHGMCQGNRSTCNCPCHKATIRKPIF